MTNKKSTKRALLLSALSLLLCVSMLVGSTFAWFTDSVTSGKNQIVAGNLDVELDYKKVVGGVATEWASVKDQTEIFDPNALWEPGHVEVVYLRVSNKGSLELKYQLGVNFKDITIGKTEDGKEIKLSDHLVFATVASDTETIYANRDEVVKAAAGTEKGLTDYNGKTTALEVNGVDYLTLIVYMPETVGNEANYRGDAIPTIELGINLYATQYTAEDDSFDELYDKNAWVKGFKVYSANELQGAIDAGEPAITLMDNIEVTEPVNIPADATVALNLNGKTLSSATNMVIYNEGTLTISGRGTVESAGQAYAIRVQKGKAIIDSVDINVKGAFGAVSIFNGADVTINGGNYSAAGIAGKTSHTIYMGGYGTLNINGGTFYRDGGGDSGGVIVGYGWENEANKKAVININGGTINSAAAWGWISNYDGAWTTISATGGLFGRNPSAIVADGFKVIENNGVYYVVPDGVSNVVTTAAQLQAALDAATSDATIVLAADINGDVTVNQKEGVNIVIDGQNYNYDGTIYLNGNSRHTGAETLAIKNIDFVTDKTLDFISCNNGQDSVIRYAHNVTVEDCTFTNKGEGTVVPARFRQCYNITMKDCTVEGTFSPLWATGVKGLTIDNVIANCKNEGINVGASDNVLIENCKITVAAANGFGIRTDATAGYKMTVNNCVLNAAETIVIRGSADTYTVTVDGGKYVSTTQELINTIKKAPVGETTTIALADGTYTNDIDITVAALGAAGGDVVIKAAEGTKPVIAGTVTIGYRQQNVGAASYNAKVTFDGITFDHAEAGKHCLNIQDVESFYMVNCTVIGDGEYGLSTPGSNGTGSAKIEKCKFVNAGLQLAGKFAQTLTIDYCEFEESVINVQGGGPLGPTIQNSKFDITLKAAHSGQSFYVIRNSNAGANIKVENCDIHVDAEQGFTGVAGSKGWGVFVNRIASYNMDVKDVKITMTDAALAQPALKVATCLSTGKINMTNVTLNGAVQ